MVLQASIHVNIGSWRPYRKDRAACLPSEYRNGAEEGFHYSSPTWHQGRELSSNKQACCAAPLKQESGSSACALAKGSNRGGPEGIFCDQPASINDDLFSVVYSHAHNWIKENTVFCVKVPGSLRQAVHLKINWNKKE